VVLIKIYAESQKRIHTYTFEYLIYITLESVHGTNQY